MDAIKDAWLGPGFENAPACQVAQIEFTLDPVGVAKPDPVAVAWFDLDGARKARALKSHYLDSDALPGKNEKWERDARQRAKT
jgi:hypothetical protein